MNTQHERGLPTHSIQQVPATSISETLAVVLLGLPVFVFIVAALRWELAIPAATFLLICLFQMVKRTDWQVSRDDVKRTAILASIAAIWVFLSGSFGVLQANLDWAKHYAILNLLAELKWWPQNSDGTLRYYLAWYLVPALVTKITSAKVGYIVASLGTVLGITLFFNIISPLFSSRKSLLIGVVAFIFFSGADLLGSFLTGFFLEFPKYHLEWWSGWIEYNSNMTAVFWVPQHALPSWLVIGLLLRMNERRELWIQPVLLVMLTLFWSPFAAIGLVPFGALLCIRHGALRTGLHWQSIGGVLLIGIPMTLFLLSGASGIPMGPVWMLGVVQPTGPHFSVPSMLLFLLIETGGPILVFILCRKAMPTNIALVAIASLMLIPLFHLGHANDFGMRASMPAICVMALWCSRALTLLPPRLAIVPLLVLLAGLPVPLTEMYRGIIATRVDFRKYTIRDAAGGGDTLIKQYFTPKSPWVLRKNGEPTPP